MISDAPLQKMRQPPLGVGTAHDIILRADENMNGLPCARVASERPVVASRMSWYAKPMSCTSWSSAHSVGLPLNAVRPVFRSRSRYDSSIVHTATSVASRSVSPELAPALIRWPSGSGVVSDGSSSTSAMAAPRTVMRLHVSVPVLSEQMVVAEPIVSHESSVFTRLFSFIIWDEEKASESVTASGSPSGTATARIVMAVMTYSRSIIGGSPS